MDQKTHNPIMRQIAYWHYYTNEENEARWKCTHCGKVVRREPRDKHYCSNCGCEMRREA